MGSRSDPFIFAICPLLVFPASSHGVEVSIPAEVDLQSPLSAGVQPLGADNKSRCNAIAGQPLGKEKLPNASEAASSFIPCPITSLQERQLHQKSSLHPCKAGEKVWKGHGSQETGIR